MRSFRIFVGPSAISLQMLMLNKWTILIKLCLIIYGLKKVP